MDPAVIKIGLMMAGIRQSELAHELGISPAGVSAVIAGRSRSRRVEAHIAKVTGLTPQELWPQWYGAPAKAEGLPPHEVAARMRQALASASEEVRRG